MPSKSTQFSTRLDGRPADTTDLAPLAFAGFAHFTAMQVRDRRIRGLDLHLARLAHATNTLFGRALSHDRIRSDLRAVVLDGVADLSCTLTVFSRAGEFTAPSFEPEPGVLVRTAPAADPPRGPLRLLPTAYERPLAAIKHVGEVAKTYYLREAVRQGFDDAVFIDRHGHLSEATIWNLAFWDGETVIWPQASMLTGVTMSILRRRLENANVPQRSEAIAIDRIDHFAGAVLMNSWSPGVAVAAIGPTSIPQSPEFRARLHRAYADEPGEHP